VVAKGFASFSILGTGIPVPVHQNHTGTSICPFRSPFLFPSIQEQANTSMDGKIHDPSLLFCLLLFPFAMIDAYYVQGVERFYYVVIIQCNFLLAHNIFVHTLEIITVYQTHRF
jgi:hypothetical protein